MTTSQAGELTVVLALSMVILSGGAFFITATGRKNLFRLGLRAYILQTIFAAGASAYLLALFLSHDFSIEYVYAYSSRDLPFFYLVSSFWAGQEGTYLLWFLLSSLFGIVLFRSAGKFKSWSLTFYSLINLFLAVMLLIVSPFKPLEFVAGDGAGLNPLLQDFWMVIHPPVMFCAYAMTGIPFAIAMAAMMKKDYEGWIRTIFPYVVVVSFLLMAANAMGGYWAYKTLGWGGYWAWDPVENTSFVPWVIALAMIHGMIIEKKTGALRRVNLLLSSVTFFLVIYGTFLTRSGVLADFSVHSFVDLGANAVLVGFLILLIILVLLVFIVKHNRRIIGRPLSYEIFSKEFILFVGMALLFALGILVMFWSSLPFITSYLSDTPAAADVATYNDFAFPFAIIISLFLTIAAYIKLAGTSRRNLKMRAVAALLLSFVISSVLLISGFLTVIMAVTLFIYLLAILFYGFSGRTIFGRLLIAHGYGAAGVIIAIILGARSFSYLFFLRAAISATAAQAGVLIRLIPSNPRRAADRLTHFGFGIMLVGILVSSAFAREERLILPRDDVRSAFGYNFEYYGLTGSIMSPNNEIMMAMGSRGEMTRVHPHYFYSLRLDGIMKRPYIKVMPFYDIYLAPLDIQELAGSAGIRLHKGETRSVDGFSIKFIDFEMTSHEQSSNITVAAMLEIEKGNKKDTIKATVTSGPHGLSGEPVPLPLDINHEIKLEKVLAGEGVVVLSIPGLAEAGPPDQLILEVSKKPGILLVWAGVIIILAGLYISYRKRYLEWRVPKQD